MLQASTATPRAARGPKRAGNAEIAGELRAAVLYADDDRGTQLLRLLGQLLQSNTMPEGRRVSMQTKTLRDVVESVRSGVASDQLTGLYNRETFLEIGARLLGVATRYEQAAHLVYLKIEGPWRSGSGGAAARNLGLRQTGRLLRDLFPDHGFHEILGRIGPGHFAALTLREDYDSRTAIMMRAFGWRPPSHDFLGSPLHIGIAHFSPERPVSIDELLAAARDAMHAPDAMHPQEISQQASPGQSPPARLGRAPTVSGAAAATFRQEPGAFADPRERAEHGRSE